MFVSWDAQKSNQNIRSNYIKLTDLAYFLDHHFTLFGLALDVLDLATKSLGVRIHRV